MTGDVHETSGLVVEVMDAVAWITLNRPGRLNALTPRLIEALASALASVADDSRIRAVVLTGEGRGFCSGADMSESVWSWRNEEAQAASFARAYTIPRILRRLPVAVIAAVNGPAAGAGVSLLAASDFRIASETAFVQFGFARLGLVPDLGLTVMLPELVGAPKALELVLNDVRLSADEAQALGLFSEVVPADSFRLEVERLASRVASLAPLAVKATKSLVYRASHEQFEEGLILESEAQRALHETEDFAEALAAYRDKRAPQFHGR
jgi:enoyl-CoA hydratase/carnithine racemase